MLSFRRVWPHRPAPAIVSESREYYAAPLGSWASCPFITSPPARFNNTCPLRLVRQQLSLHPHAVRSLQARHAMEHHQQHQPQQLSTCTPLDTMSQEQQQFLKLEDVHHSATASPSPSYDMSSESATHTSQTSPAPVYVTSKPAKKRKSWGQTLPEPKTTLPPRKRAKTDDEKEQRRIERIKRNRAAAHNSRERKRQETETLAVQVAKLTAELNAYKQLHGPLPASVVLPEVTLCTEDGYVAFP